MIKNSSKKGMIFSHQATKPPITANPNNRSQVDQCSPFMAYQAKKWPPPTQPSINNQWPSSPTPNTPQDHSQALNIQAINILSVIFGFHPWIRKYLDKPSQVINTEIKVLFLHASKLGEDIPEIRRLLKSIDSKFTKSGTILGTKTAIRSNMRLASLRDMECLIAPLNQGASIQTLANKYESEKQEAWDKHINILTKELLKEILIDNPKKQGLFQDVIIEFIKNNPNIAIQWPKHPSRKDLSNIIDTLYQQAPTQIAECRNIFNPDFSEISTLKKVGDTIIQNKRMILSESADACIKAILSSSIHHALEGVGWLMLNAILGLMIVYAKTDTPNDYVSTNTTMTIKGLMGHAFNRLSNKYTRIMDIQFHDFLKVFIREALGYLYKHDDPNAHSWLDTGLSYLSGSHIAHRNLINKIKAFINDLELSNHDDEMHNPKFMALQLIGSEF